MGALRKTFFMLSNLIFILSLKESRNVDSIITIFGVRKWKQGGAW